MIPVVMEIFYARMAIPFYELFLDVPKTVGQVMYAVPSPLQKEDHD
jgi:hypothetical protein